MFLVAESKLGAQIFLIQTIYRTSAVSLALLQTAFARSLYCVRKRLCIDLGASMRCALPVRTRLTRYWCVSQILHGPLLPSSSGMRNMSRESIHCPPVVSMWTLCGRRWIGSPASCLVSSFYAFCHASVTDMLIKPRCGKVETVRVDGMRTVDVSDCLGVAVNPDSDLRADAVLGHHLQDEAPDAQVPKRTTPTTRRCAGRSSSNVCDGEGQ